MVNIYYAKSQNRLPGGLSELAWRLCIYAIRQELFPPGSGVIAPRHIDDLSDRGKRDGLIEYAERGKPCLKKEISAAAGREQPWYFNLSHSGEYAVCATADEKIGCDIQRISPERKRLAERFFHEAERNYIEHAEGTVYGGTAGEPKERDGRFTRIWTMRESYVKMTGEGIAVMDEFYIDTACEDATVLRKSDTIEESTGAAFFKEDAAFRQMEIDPGYSCTVCCENSAVFDASVPCFNLTGVLE